MEDNFAKWQTREGIKNLPEYPSGGTTPTGGTSGEYVDDDDV
jgi:hypothetical protein